jgi:putative ABC transport system permease protein
MNDLRFLATIGLLWRRFTLRHWRMAPRQTGLQVLILALGIAVFFSIRLANRAAVSSFQNFTGLISQQSDWQISAPAGALPESVPAELRAAFGDLPVDIIPVMETTAARTHTQSPEEIGARETFRLIGLDLVSVQNLASASDADRGWFDQTKDKEHDTSGHPYWDLLGQTNAVFISATMAEKSQIKIGDLLPLVINENIVSLTVAGIIPQSPGRPAAPANLLIMDLPAVQRLCSREGRLDRIEFIIPDGPNAESERHQLHDQLAALGQNRWQVLSPEDRRAGADIMTRAFRMNLTILSLIGLVVGLYLIFQSLDGAVVRRRQEIGILRSLGVTEKIIQAVWLLEALCLGLAGGVVGILLGWGGAQFAVRLVGRTVNALYYATTVNSARLDVREFIIALLLAIGTSLLAGWWPARQAAKTPPAQILSLHVGDRETKSRWQSTGLALTLLLVSAALASLPPLRFAGALRFPIGGYLAGLGLIVGGGILCSQLMQRVAQSLRFTGQWSLSAKMATSHLAQSSSRHRLAAAGLLCAVTMAAGMIVLVASFDTTMRGWINTTFQADLYISSDGAQSASTENRISPATWQAIAASPAIAEINVMQAARINLNGVNTMLVGVDLAFSERHQNLAWRQPPLNETVFNAEQNDHQAIASESFCERFRVHRGDTVIVPTPAGKQAITIAGVFSDYGNERGSLVVDRIQFAKWFGDELATSLIIILRPGIAPENIQGELEQKYPGLSILTNRHLRGEILRIFRQTFSVTYALELIGILVAVIGLGMTLSSILLDRRSELTTLRALGWRHRQMAFATAVEGALLSICGVTAGIVVSLGLGWILIYVINKQSFGWTLQFSIPWPSLAALGFTVIGTGTVVSYFVGRWGSGLPADHEE